MITATLIQHGTKTTLTADNRSSLRSMVSKHLDIPTTRLGILRNTHGNMGDNYGEVTVFNRKRTTVLYRVLVASFEVN